MIPLRLIPLNGTQRLTQTKSQDLVLVDLSRVTQVNLSFLSPPGKSRKTTVLVVPLLSIWVCRLPGRCFVPVGE